MPQPALNPLLARAFTAGQDQTELTATDARILDAALDLVAAYGVRRTSMDDIAERARVGRRTVFRRFGSKEEVVERLMARELQRFLTSVSDTIAAAPDPASSVVEAFVAVVRIASDHPLIDRLARVEPQSLIESARTGDPSPLDLGRAFVAQRIRAGQRRGVIPKRDADQLADVLVRLALTYVLIPDGIVDVADDKQLRAFARSAIAPILTPDDTP